MSKRILSISRSPHLLIGRNDALAIAGYAVSSPRNPLDAVRLLERDVFMAAVIGHSVPPAERAEIIPAIRRLRPNLPIIFIAPKHEPPEPLADRIVDLAETPVALITMLEELLESGSPA